MIAITHTPTDGTILEGTTRGDGTNQLLKPLTWRWSRQLAVWYLPASRDTAPRTAVITGTAEKLRAAGHEVIVAIDGRHRDPEVVEADRAAPGAAGVRGPEDALPRRHRDRVPGLRQPERGRLQTVGSVDEQPPPVVGFRSWLVPSPRVVPSRMVPSVGVWVMAIIGSAPSGQG